MCIFNPQIIHGERLVERLVRKSALGVTIWSKRQSYDKGLKQSLYVYNMEGDSGRYCT